MFRAEFQDILDLCKTESRDKRGDAEIGKQPGWARTFAALDYLEGDPDLHMEKDERCTRLMEDALSDLNRKVEGSNRVFWYPGFPALAFVYNDEERHMMQYSLGTHFDSILAQMPEKGKRLCAWGRRCSLWALKHDLMIIKIPLVTHASLNKRGGVVLTLGKKEKDANHL